VLAIVNSVAEAERQRIHTHLVRLHEVYQDLNRLINQDVLKPIPVVSNREIPSKYVFQKLSRALGEQEILVDKILTLPFKTGPLKFSETLSLIALEKDDNSKKQMNPIHIYKSPKNGSEDFIKLDVKEFTKELNKSSLKILTSDPREFRANVFLRWIPVNLPSFYFSDGYRAFFKSGLSKYLRSDPTKWDFLLPEIKIEPCLPPDPIPVKLPKIGEKLCEEFKNYQVGIGCRPGQNDSNGLKKERNSEYKPAPIKKCFDRQSKTLETVIYTKETSKNLNISDAKALIPVENYLALFSFSEKLTQINNWKDLSNLRRFKPDFLNKFTPQLGNHFLKHQEYYKKYWSHELDTICQDTRLLLRSKKSAPLSLFYDQLSKGGFCVTTCWGMGCELLQAPAHDRSL
jgi:hypothetical protein